MDYVNPIAAITGRPARILSAERYFGAPLPALSGQQGTVTIGGQKTYWQDYEIEEAFNRLCAAALAHDIDVPVAPALVTGSGDAKHPARLFSLAGFDLPVPAKVAINHEPYRPSEEEDLRNWLAHMRDRQKTSLLDFEYAVFTGCRRPISAALPFFAFIQAIAALDIGPHNTIVDGRRLAEYSAQPRAKRLQNESFGSYFIDCFLENSLDPPEKIEAMFVKYCTGFPTILDTIIKEREKERENETFLYKCGDEAIADLFLPSIDWHMVGRTMKNIAALDDRPIRAITSRIEKTLADIPDIDRSELAEHAETMAGRLIAQRDRIGEFCQPSSAPALGAETFNPFAAFPKEFRRRMRRPDRRGPPNPSGPGR